MSDRCLHFFVTVYCQVKLLPTALLLFAVMDGAIRRIRTVLTLLMHDCSEVAVHKHFVELCALVPSAATDLSV